MWAKGLDKFICKLKTFWHVRILWFIVALLQWVWYLDWFMQFFEDTLLIGYDILKVIVLTDYMSVLKANKDCRKKYWSPIWFLIFWYFLILECFKVYDFWIECNLIFLFVFQSLASCWTLRTTRCCYYNFIFSCGLCWQGPTFSS